MGKTDCGVLEGISRYRTRRPADTTRNDKDFVNVPGIVIFNPFK
jgi:hypothetical protein